MTEQEKTELIAHMESVIAQYESDSYKFPLSEKVYRIALASMTAQPVAVVVGKLGAGIRATAFEAAPRPELGQLLYDGPTDTRPVKLPKSERLDGNGYGYYFDMNDVFTALEEAGIKFEMEG